MPNTLPFGSKKPSTDQLLHTCRAYIEYRLPKYKQRMRAATFTREEKLELIAIKRDLDSAQQFLAVQA